MVSKEIIDGFTFGIAEPHELLEVRRIHHDEYLRRGYIDQPQPDGIINDLFIDFSIYFACRENQTGRIVGVIRVINSGSALGLPTTNEFTIWASSKEKLSRINPAHIVEIGSLAEAEGYRIAEGLYRQVWIHSKVRSLLYWMASIDKRVLKSYKYRGFPWDDIGEIQYYMGSDTVPVILELSNLPISLSLRSPKLFEYIDGTKPDQLYSNKTIAGAI